MKFKAHLAFAFTAVGCGVAFLLVVFGTLKFAESGGDSWRVGDWLINYSGGFVRRGLFGALLHGLARGLQLAPMSTIYIVLWTQVGLWLAFVSASLFLLRRNLASGWWGAALVCACPATLWFEAYHQNGFRKELLGLVLLAFAAVWMNLRPTRAEATLRVATWASVPIVLCHEANLVFLPFLFALAPPEAMQRKAFFKLLLPLVLVVFAFALTVLVPSDQSTVEGIVDSWRGLVPGRSFGEKGGGAIRALGGNTEAAIYGVLRRINSEKYDYMGKYGRAALFILSAFALQIGLWRKLSSSIRAVGLAVLGSLLTLSLMVVALDWGRILYMLASAWMVVLLSQASGEPWPGENRLLRFARNALALGAGAATLAWSLPISSQDLDDGLVCRVTAEFRQLSRPDFCPRLPSPALRRRVRPQNTSRAQQVNTTLPRATPAERSADDGSAVPRD